MKFHRTNFNDVFPPEITAAKNTAQKIMRKTSSESEMFDVSEGLKHF